MWTKLALLGMCMLGLAACDNVRATYTPQVTSAAGPVTARAVRFYPGDMAHVAKAQAQVLGRLELAGYTDQEQIKREADALAAKEGGTHLILDEGDVAVRFAAIAAGQASSGPAVAAYESQERGLLQSLEPRRAVYLVVRVPPEAWGALPPPLRPNPLPGTLPPTLTNATTPR